MQLQEAIPIIRHQKLTQGSPQHWADLGCGNGMFTLALAEILPEESEILAVDKSRSALHGMPGRHKGVKINTLHGDFTEIELPEGLDGIMMANALHYVKDAGTFLEKLADYLAPDGHFLIVEYDTDRGNPWVPYPQSFGKLGELMASIGFKYFEKLGSRPGNFGKEMYGVLVGRNEEKLINHFKI